jgi:Ni,Fe-hydrogenase III small subunit
MLAELGASFERAAWRRLGRSLSIREVDAGSCNGCELEIHALNNAFYDLERFGLRFVASPRHADVLLVTGPVTRNMREALSAVVPVDLHIRGCPPRPILKRRIEEASRYLKLEQLGLSPQCGFATSAAEHVTVTEEVERAKLARIVEVAQQIWGSAT